MDMRYVQSFVAVVECGSIAEAARHLDLTPAAVAARIHSLEEDLGTHLLKRSGRYVRATAEGVKVLESAHALLRAVRDMRAAARDGAVQVGELRLGVFVSAMTTVLPSMLDRVYAAFPDLSIFVEPGTSIDLCRKVGAGELDLAVVVEPQFNVPKYCEWHPLMAEPLIVIAPAALAGSDPHVLLRNEPFIRYDRAVLGGQLADRYLRDHAIHPRQRLEIDGVLAIAALVDRGLGVSLLPGWPSMWSAGVGVARISLPDRTPVRRIGLIAGRNTPRATLVQAFIAEAVEVFKTETQD